MAVQAAQQMVTCSRRPMGSHGVPILASKITKPNVPGWILQRPRVTTLIAQGTRWCPLTIVTGLPGTGKTMALALWAAAGPGPVAWVTPDKYDNRPRVFWSYVVAALRRSGVALPQGTVRHDARTDGGARVLAPARVGPGRPGSAGDAGRR